MHWSTVCIWVGYPLWVFGLVFLDAGSFAYRLVMTIAVVLSAAFAGAHLERRHPRVNR